MNKKVLLFLVFSFAAGLIATSAIISLSQKNSPQETTFSLLPIDTNQLSKQQQRGIKPNADSNSVPSMSFQESGRDNGNTSHSDGTSLIASSVNLIAKAVSTRNLSGLLVQINQIDTCSYPVVKVFSTMTNKEQKSMTNLLASDFNLYEDGKQIKTFGFKKVSLSNNPLTVFLVIDKSGSMKGEAILKAKAAAQQFVSLLDNKDKVGIIQFDSKIDLLLSPTQNKETVRQTIGKITVNSNTALYDVIGFSSQKINQCGRKAIILLTDGRDTASQKYSLGQALDRANLKNSPVFVVGLKSNQFSPQILKQIAEGTGGQYFEAPAPKEIAKLYSLINEQLKNQYVLEYQASSPAGVGKHRIKLTSSAGGSETSSEKSFSSTL